MTMTTATAPGQIAKLLGLRLLVLCDTPSQEARFGLILPRQTIDQYPHGLIEAASDEVLRQYPDAIGLRCIFRHDHATLFSHDGRTEQRRLIIDLADIEAFIEDDDEATIEEPTP